MDEILPRIPSDRKRVAARLNGAKAKGTKSPEGLAISALNAVKHGITARTTFLLECESQELWDELYACYSERFQPYDLVEERLVCQLVLCEWRRERIQDVEASILDYEMLQQSDKLNKQYEVITDDIRLALAFLAQHEILSRLCYYMMRVDHDSNRAYNRLVKLQERRPPLPPDYSDAPALHPQPEPEPSVAESIVQNEANAAGETPSETPQASTKQHVKSVRAGRYRIGPRLIRRRAQPAPIPPDSAVSAHHAREVAKAAS